MRDAQLIHNAGALRELYETTRGQPFACQSNLLAQLHDKLIASAPDNLAALYASALLGNEPLDLLDVPFIPDSRTGTKGRNMVTRVLDSHSAIEISDTQYSFTYVNREIPHLRAKHLAEQKSKAWIDYVAYTKTRPVLGEVKWLSDENAFFAFIQLLTYLSEMATERQIARAIKHKLFGGLRQELTAFDLHIFLGNYNARSKKSRFIELTRELVVQFKQQLMQYPGACSTVGDIVCIDATIDTSTETLESISTLWRI